MSDVALNDNTDVELNSIRHRENTTAAEHGGTNTENGKTEVPDVNEKSADNVTASLAVERYRDKLLIYGVNETPPIHVLVICAIQVGGMIARYPRCQYISLYGVLIIVKSSYRRINLRALILLLI